MGWLFHGYPATRMAEVETPGMGLLRPVNKLPYTHLLFFVSWLAGIPSFFVPHLPFWPLAEKRLLITH